MSDKKTTRRWMPAAILGGVLLLLAVAGLAANWIWGGSDDTQDTAEAPAGETAPVVSESVTSDFASECQETLSTDDSGVDDDAPTVDQWVSAGYNVTPMSTTYGGCRESESGLRVGFAQTDAGALFAATTYAIGVSPSGINAEDRIQETVSEGPDKEEMLERAASISQGEVEAADAEALRSAEVTGYDAREVTDETASFTIYLEITDGSGQRMTAAGQADLVWEDGDWKIDPASGSELMTVAQAVGEPSVEWGPNHA